MSEYERTLDNWPLPNRESEASGYNKIHSTQKVLLTPTLGSQLLDSLVDYLVQQFPRYDLLKCES